MAGRINKYVEYRRRVESTKEKFSAELSNKVAESQTQAKPAQVAQKRGAGAAKSGKMANRGAVTQREPSVARQQARQMKYITQAQAQRLAQYAPAIKQAAVKYNVPVELICGVILQESGGKSRALSHCGARGLMQLMPGTAKRMGVTNSFDPHQNIMGGTKYLRFLLDRFDGNVSLALAGYNAGEGNVEKYGRKIPPFKETRAYVPNVLKYADTLWAILRGSSRRVDVKPAVRVVQPTIYHRTIFVSTRRV